MFRWDDGRVRRGRVEEVVAPGRLGPRWVGADGDESSVVFELDETDGGTRVTDTERGLRPIAWARRVEMLGRAARAVPA